MIIKKKYTTIKKVIDEAPEDDTLSLIDDVVQTYENEQEEEPVQDEIPQELYTEEETEVEEQPSEEEIKKERDIQDLDLSLQNIRFEQREERREGTRRRGYRRSHDRNIVTRAQQDAISIRDVAKKEGYNDGIKNAQPDLEDLRNQFA